jgi:hypothetical protein
MRATDELRARWYLFGAQAVALHGAQRATQDVDVTILVDTPPRDVVVALRRQKIVPRIDDAAFIAQTRVIPCDHAGSGWKIDVVLGGPGLEELIADEAIETTVGRLRVPVVRLEHLLMLKILAGRPNDLEDVRRLVRARRDIDHAEVTRLLTAIERELAADGLVGAYERARSEVKR